MSESYIAECFRQHYADQDHEVLKSSSLLDPSTPMTFVGSAGLAQIENGIEQGEERQGERYVLVQICFRHFDIEKVGKTPVHLSLFGMGGAFSFGEVSRSDTLSKIWSFFTDELGIDTSRLWATCFSGGTLEGHLFPPDETTRETWVALGLNPTHVVEVGIETGFWKQGDGLSGKERYRKCGPTTELFYDRGTHLRCGPGCRPGCGCGRFIEISNILFIHFYIDEATKTVAPIVTPFDETVIGIERVATALCELETVFDLPAFERAIRFIRTAYDPREVMGTDNREESARVIADHARALLFLTADDAPAPGKGGRARIMRLLVRGIVTRLRILRIQNKAFFPDLIDLLLETYGDRYPHLVDGRDKVVTYFDEERETFRQTLSRGYQRLDEILAEDEQAAVSGAQALHLVKEKGLPYPLLKATLEHRSIPFQPQEYWRAHERWYQGILAQTQNAS